MYNGIIMEVPNDIDYSIHMYNNSIGHDGRNWSKISNITEVVTAPGE